ncbi:hypothetical protein MRX96_014709 [Rhipicephalus microplus]
MRRSSPSSSAAFPPRPRGQATRASRDPDRDDWHRVFDEDPSIPSQPGPHDHSPPSDRRCLCSREKFDPNYVRLVTRGRDPATAVACLLGFFKLVCEDGYKELRALSDDSEPRATMDDFYVLLGVLLRNLACVPGDPLGHYWFLMRVAELLKIFPGVSEAPPVPLYSQAQADAVSNFGQRWPHTRAALCRTLLGSQFEGPMRQLQEYVTEGWRFAGMKHAYLILKFLGCRNSWALDIIPRGARQGCHTAGTVNRRTTIGISRDFLEAYLKLGANGPYMNLLHLPEAELANRRCLGIHMAAAYAFAVFEDKTWLQYKGVPQDEAEQAVLAKITAIKRMGLGAPPKDGPSAARFGVRCSHGETRARSQEHRREDRDAQGPSTATTSRFRCCEAMVARRASSHHRREDRNAQGPSTATTTRFKCCEAMVARRASSHHGREDQDAQGPSTATTTRFKCCEAMVARRASSHHRREGPGPARSVDGDYHPLQVLRGYGGWKSF